MSVRSEHLRRMMGAYVARVIGDLFGGRDVDDRTYAGRLFALFAMGLAMVFVLTGWLLPSESVNSALTLALVAMAFAALGVFLPWHAVPATTPFALMIAGLFAVAAAGEPAYRGLHHYVGLYVVLFAYIGLTQPPGRSIIAAPLMLTSFLIARELAVDDGATDLGQTVVAELLSVLLMGTLLGETLAQLLRRRHVVTDGVTRLLDAVGFLNHLDDEREALNEVARVCADVLGADSAVVMIAESPDSTRYQTAGRANAEGTRSDARIIDIGVGASATAAAILAGRTVFAGDDTAARLMSPTLVADLGARSIVAFPLRSDGEPVGALIAIWREPVGTLDRLRLESAELLADQAGKAVGRLQQRSALTVETLTDPLTGLSNRRHLDLMLQRVRPGDGVVLLDLDHFKRVNDSLGHAVGDQVLRRFGECLRSVARGDDCAARYGGEEFALLLPGTGQRGAAQVIERVRERWLSIENGLTFSAGYTVARTDEDPQVTLARADEALYLAKALGRDRAEVA